MAKTKAVEYGDSSISALKGADRVRKRPAVILALTVLTAVNIQFLKFFLTLLTRRERATAKNYRNEIFRRFYRGRGPRQRYSR